MELSLNKRFHALWLRCLIANSSFDTESVFQALSQHYSSPDRYYHGMNHIHHCLEQFDKTAHLIPHPDTVEAALWYHDAIYKPGRQDNEQKSAELFLSDAASFSNDEFKNKVNKLILATTHKNPPMDIDECFIVDIDLSSIGSEWGDFITDTENLRKEQPDVSDPEYFRAHTLFLKYLLSRNRIFYTDFFYTRYEQTALQNILRLLAIRKTQGHV